MNAGEEDQLLHEGAEEEEEQQITEAEKKDLKLTVEEPTQGLLSEESDIRRARELFEKDTGIDVEVCNPQEKKGGAFSKNFTTYDIVGKDKNGEIKVSRRYKEFDLLRTKLKESWPGIFIPALPEKKVANSDAKVVNERLIFLDHFMKKCAKMVHIFYCDEMQTFLHSTGSSDELLRYLNQVQPKKASALYLQYQQVFADYDVEVESAKDLEAKVFKKIEALKPVLQDVNRMRDSLKRMATYRKDMKHLRASFTNYMGKDAISKIKALDEQEKQKAEMRDFAAVEGQDDITTLNSNLKVLKKDIECFFQITNDLSGLLKAIGHNSGIVTQCSKELEQVKSSDKEVVSEGLFKKVSKETKIRELQTAIDEAKTELDAAHRLKVLILVMLDKQEIPLIFYVKNIGMASGMTELVNKRRAALNREREILNVIVGLYPQAAQA